MGIGSRQLALRHAGSRPASDDAPSAEGRALIAALLSVLAPGTGQLLLGRRRRGLLMLGASLVVVAGGVGVWRIAPLSVLALLVRPAVLLILLVVNFVLLAFRGFAVVDAYRLGRGRADGAVRRSVRRSSTTVALTLLLILTAAPHVAVGYYDLLTYQLLTEVFPSAGDAGEQRAGSATGNDAIPLTLPVTPVRALTPSPASVTGAVSTPPPDGL